MFVIKVRHRDCRTSVLESRSSAAERTVLKIPIFPVEAAIAIIVRLSKSFSIKIDVSCTA